MFIDFPWLLNVKLPRGWPLTCCSCMCLFATWIGCKFCRKHLICDTHSAHSTSCLGVQSMAIQLYNLENSWTPCLYGTGKPTLWWPIYHRISLASPRFPQTGKKMIIQILPPQPSVLSIKLASWSKLGGSNIVFFVAASFIRLLGVLEWLVTGINKQRNGLEVTPQSQRPPQQICGISGAQTIAKRMSRACCMFLRYVRIEEPCGCQRTNNLKLLKRLPDGHVIMFPCMTRARHLTCWRLGVGVLLRTFAGPQKKRDGSKMWSKFVPSSGLQTGLSFCSMSPWA